MTDREQMTNALLAIDDTLAGNPVAPEHAELAELCVILSGERPQARPEFTSALNQRAARRFGAAPAGGGRRRLPARWLFAPAAGAFAAIVVALVLVLGHTGQPVRPPVDQGLSAAPPRLSGVARSPGAVASSSASAAAGSGSAAAGSASAAAGSGAAAGSLAVPASPGRKVIQSSQLTLGAGSSQVDSVAQQIFAVVAREDGVIDSSQVTASKSSSGYGQFQITVPSARLSQTMAALSELRGARVLSRSDATQDVTGQIGGAGRRLGEARALRTSLLRRLAAATTSTAVASLKAQIRDADAAINRDLAVLHSLQHQVARSQIMVLINNSPAPVFSFQNSSGFTLGRAVHDAGRVLVVAAGVTLIALAALVPAGLLLGLLVWIATAVRQRRREQALDLI